LTSVSNGIKYLRAGSVELVLPWPFTQLGTSDANNHMRKAGHFHAAGEFIRLSARLSLHSGSPVTHFVAPVAPPVVSTVTP
jgi:hypothetical protein